MTIIMGVVNVTPDSFSDGGRWFDPAGAAAHGRRLIAEGADVIDVGGESSRPGATPVPEREEMRRVLPVIETLAAEVRVSIDTRKRVVAEAAIDAGATIVNDTTGLLWEVAAEAGVGWVAMHCPAEPAVMAAHAHYDDVVAEVTEYLKGRASLATAAGVSELWIDPGIGFAKTAAHNLALLRHLDQLVATGWPVAIGTSRKSFLGALTADPNGTPAPVNDRLEASITTAAWSALHGAGMIRVHDVAPTVAALALSGLRPVPAAA